MRDCKQKFSIGNIGFVLGPILFCFVIVIPFDALSFEAKTVLGLSLWMGVWWVTEAIPIYITALLPLVIFPLLSVTDFSKTSAYYADRIVFLLLGGFFLASTIERSNLHQRFAFTMLKFSGTNPKYIIGAFVIVTGSLSAWMSNTATTVLMLPIGAAILSSINIHNKERFGSCLVLCIAYAASIGGTSTLIGTPPNAIFASLSRSLVGVDVSFIQWMLVGIPVSAITLFVMWFYMVNVGVKLKDVSVSGEKDFVLKKLENLGKLSRDEKVVGIVFAATIIAWVTRGLLWGNIFPFVDDSTIAILAAISVFLIPSTKNKRLLDWSVATKIPWGILLLIGGGLALAGGFTATGIDQWVASQMSFLKEMHYFVILLVLVFIVVFLEFMSNTATAALLIPISAALASVLDINPLLLMMPVAIAASFGFILPTSTPANAIVLSGGNVSTKRMAKVGLPLNLIAVVLVALLTSLLVPILW
jgi:sodium-dependent dicarboxylate transporter 2/3/5